MKVRRALQRAVPASRLGRVVLTSMVVPLLAGCGTSPGLTRLTDRGDRDRPVPETRFIAASECRDCHPAQYREWRASMHAYAQHSPVVEAFNRFVLRGSGGAVGSFCARCHTPIGIASGEGPLRPNPHRSVVAMDSVSCTVCHSQHTRNGQASGEIPVPVPGSPEPTIYGPYAGYDETGADATAPRLIKAPHVARRSDVITTGRFCGACHDVIFPNGVRLEEAFAEWKNSRYARAGITCQACHMSPVPGKPVPRSEWAQVPIVDDDLFPDAPPRYRTSHKFTGPDYSLLPDFAKADLKLDDAEFRDLEAELEGDRRTLLENAATLTVRHPETIAPGARLAVTVVVTNSGTGHNLPTGLTAERQVWVEVVVQDARDRVLYTSGDLDRFGDLRDWMSEEVGRGAVALDRDLLNLQSKFILHGFRGTDTEGLSATNRLLDPVPFQNPMPVPVGIVGFTPGYARIFKNGIPPGATRTAVYRMRVPDEAVPPLRLRVRLRFRNFPPHLFRDLGIPDLRDKLRIVDMQTYAQEILVAPPLRAAP